MQGPPADYHRHWYTDDIQATDDEPDHPGQATDDQPDHPGQATDDQPEHPSQATDVEPDLPGQATDDLPSRRTGVALPAVWPRPA